MQVSPFFLNQGQLELLRRLFTEALYEEVLSQVSEEGGASVLPSYSSSLGATGSAFSAGTAKPGLTWSPEVGMGLTYRRIPEQSCFRKKSQWL